MAKAKKQTSRGRKQDRARVAGGQDYEVKYETKKKKRTLERCGEESGQEGRQQPQTLGASAWPLSYRMMFTSAAC